MRHVVLVLVLLTGVTPTPARGQPIPSPRVDRVRLLEANQAGVHMVWEIPTERATALPRWDLDAGPAPLAIDEATRIARAWLSRGNPQVERFAIQEVQLSRVGTSSPAAEGFWYYTVFFVAPGQPGKPSLFYAVVLPDGSPVEPTRSPPK